MSLMLYLDDAMKVLLQNDFIEDGYIDNDGGSEIVRNELEQKCYLREPVDIVRCKDCKHRGDRHKCIVAFVAEKQEMPYFFYDNRGEWFCADGERRME
jgi:hypothetical protein